VLDVELAAGCVVVVVDPLPLLGTPADGLAEPPPDPQADASTPTSTTPARRAASFVSRCER
jgi:hypothetical protein